MRKALDQINNTEQTELESMFRDCCGSTRWANQMASSRPFASEKELIDVASAIWNDLTVDDWLEAFSAHPKIGETKTAETRSAEWSAGEQSGMDSADKQVKQELAEANSAYHEKFGFIFIVCATGRTANEMLELCRERLGNDRETEIGIAAAEQQKITDIRLRKLCGGS